LVRLAAHLGWHSGSYGDHLGHLIAESNNSGVVQREYIWLDDLPVAMVDSNGGSPVLYFIHADRWQRRLRCWSGYAWEWFRSNGVVTA
jgi:hypothetical protein